MIYRLGSQLQETDLNTITKEEVSAVIVTTEDKYAYILKALKIQAEVDVSLSEIFFCKLESQQECLYGTLSIPPLLDVLGQRYQIAYIVTDKYVVLIDNSAFVERLIRRIRTRKVHQGETRERFLSNFIAEFI